MQSAGATPQQNPLGHLIGAALSAAGKGMGKGGGFPQGGAPGANPWEAMMQNCFAPHAGEGAASGQMQNPMQQMLGAMLAKGAGKGNACWPGEMSPQDGYAGQGTTVETSTHVTPESTGPVSEANHAPRAAFEESVNDLVNMGLVADSQTARELLTNHGDISTVVAILTEG